MRAPSEGASIESLLGILPTMVSVTDARGGL